MTTLFSHARFLKGASAPRHFPPDAGEEVAFAGRSNAGKSSALNALAGRRGLARTSKQPGRTRELNFFELGEACRLVDLPGYGFARVPLEMKRRWESVMEAYLSHRECLRGMVLVMDVRHPLTPLDLRLMDWSARGGVPLHVLLTKADKLSRGRRGGVLHQARKDLAAYPGEATVQLFAAPERLGVAELEMRLLAWLPSCVPTEGPKKKAPV